MFYDCRQNLRGTTKKFHEALKLLSKLTPTFRRKVPTMVSLFETGDCSDQRPKNETKVPTMVYYSPQNLGGMTKKFH
jgi:hypothetical protein